MWKTPRQPGLLLVLRSAPAGRARAAPARRLQCYATSANSQVLPFQVPETRVVRVRSGQVRPVQVRAVQIGEGQVGVAQVRVNQLRERQPRVGQPRVGQVRAVQVRVGQVRAGRIRVAQVRAAKLRAVQVLHQQRSCAKARRNVDSSAGPRAALSTARTSGPASAARSPIAPNDGDPAITAAIATAGSPASECRRARLFRERW